MGIREEVLKAYGDSNEHGFDARSLMFWAEGDVSPKTAVLIMEEALRMHQGECSEFEVSMLQTLPEGCLVRLARENSFCVYVKGDTEAIKAWAKQNKADEIDLATEESLAWIEHPELAGYVRVWWD